MESALVRNFLKLPPGDGPAAAMLISGIKLVPCPRPHYHGYGPEAPVQWYR